MVLSNSRINNILVQRRLSVAAGGAGIDVALMREEVYIQNACALLRAGAEQSFKVTEMLRSISEVPLFDSDRREEMLFEPTFAAHEPLKLITPLSYRPLESPSGQMIKDRIDTPPFNHLKDWPGLLAITNKSSDSEAEGCRLFGAVNGMVNIRPIQNHLCRALQRLNSVTTGQDWLALSDFLPLDEGIRVDFFSSIAGGQGSGLLILLLSLLALLIADYRERVKIYVHLLLPGFHQAQNDIEEADQYMKAMAVLRDLAVMKMGARPINIPFPDANLRLDARHTKELYNYAFVYQPVATNVERYKAFVTRVSHTIVAGELSVAAADVRRSRSNASNLAHRARHLALVGGQQ